MEGDTEGASLTFQETGQEHTGPRGGTRPGQAPEGCLEEVVPTERTAEDVQRGLRGEDAGIPAPRPA